MGKQDIFADMIGAKILEVNGLGKDSDDLIIKTTKGNYRFYHKRDCCETVTIDDVVGELKVDAVIHEVLEKTSDSDDNSDESYTWTFYTIRTSKGYCDIKWYGECNGYYSKTVDVEKLKE